MTTVTKHVGYLLGIAAMAILASLWGGPAAAHGVTLKVHHALPADSPFHTQFLVAWAEKVESESAGRLRIQLLPALGTGGSAAQLFDQVKDGAADLAWIAAADTPARFPAFEAFELSFATNGAQGASRALWEYARVNDLASKEFRGVRLLAVAQHGTPQLHLRSHPVRSLADLAGLKIGSISRATSTLLAAAKANPVETSSDRLREALSKGELDGVALPWEAVTALAIDELLKHHTEADAQSPWLGSGVYVLAMNPATYKSLPDDLRKVIGANSGAETSAWIGKVFDASAASARKLAADRGDGYDTLPATDLAKWKAPAQTVVADRIKDLDKRGLKGEELVESARASLVQYGTVK
jgi:TRAP-type C4-dicarboxylate transport system substrate-binding protein